LTIDKISRNDLILKIWVKEKTLSLAKGTRPLIRGGKMKEKENIYGWSR